MTDKELRDATRFRLIDAVNAARSWFCKNTKPRTASDCIGPDGFISQAFVTIDGPWWGYVPEHIWAPAYAAAKVARAVHTRGEIDEDVEFWCNICGLPRNDSEVAK